MAKEVVVRKHMVVITSPPDARYSPLGLLPKQRQLFSEVRALVIPVIPDRSGTKFPVLPQVCHAIVGLRYLQYPIFAALGGIWKQPFLALALPCVLALYLGLMEAVFAWMWRVQKRIGSSVAFSCSMSADLPCPRNSNRKSN